MIGRHGRGAAKTNKTVFTSPARLLIKLGGSPNWVTGAPRQSLAEHWGSDDR